MKSKDRLARKLLLFIFSISFLLITGSFIYFYFSAKSYLYNKSISEIDVYHFQFDQSSQTQIEDYNNKINGYLIDSKFSKQFQENPVSALSPFLNANQGVITEILVLSNNLRKAYILKPVVVFGGEQIINADPISPEEYNRRYNNIAAITELYSNFSFGYAEILNIHQFYFKKEFNEFSFIFTLNKLALFKDVVDKIYHPPNINFNIINSKNVIELSTNPNWINQLITKYIPFENISKNYFEDRSDNLVVGGKKCEMFNDELYITNDLSNSYQDFNTIILKLFLYSLIVLILIFVITTIYAKRISVSLNEISKVTNLVSEGNFNNKIMIQRNDELGLLIGAFNNMIDNLKESYDKLDVTNKELENKIEELIKTKSELTKQQKLALIGETISKISHEIQNKISGVSVWVQNLEMQVKLDKTTKMYIKEINKSLNSFAMMLQNFKKFYRKPFLEKTHIYLEDIIIRIINQYKADLTAKNIEILKKFNTNDSTIFADKNLIEELLINIFVNAIYFTPENGKIAIEKKVDKDKMIIEISDNGSGISEDDIENIFTPFFTTKSSGSGLGLAICKNIVDAHNGEIHVYNNEPNGTNFKIILPINM